MSTTEPVAADEKTGEGARARSRSRSGTGAVKSSETRQAATKQVAGTPPPGTVAAARARFENAAAPSLARPRAGSSVQARPVSKRFSKSKSDMLGDTEEKATDQADTKTEKASTPAAATAVVKQRTLVPEERPYSRMERARSQTSNSSPFRAVACPGFQGGDGSNELMKALAFRRQKTLGTEKLYHATGTNQSLTIDDRVVKTGSAWSEDCDTDDEE